jgi:sigma-B regulation protein RsbU (phosphoserine phosphatase)
MFHSFTARLIAWSLILTGVVYVTAISLSNRAGRATAIAAAEREANDDTDAAALAVEDILNTAEESGAALARAVSELHPTPDALDRLVRRFSADNRDTVARYAVILASDGDAVRPLWYRNAQERSAPGWSEPYRDPELQNTIVITRTVPIRAPDGGFGGAVAVSLRLDFLSSVVREVHLGASGFALVLSRGGLLVAHSRRDLSDEVHDPLAELSPSLRAVVEPVVRRATAERSGFAAVPFDGRVFRLTFRPIAGTEWFLATAYAEDELLADVSQLQRTQIILAGSGLAILAVAIVTLSRRMTRPLGALAASAGRLATGDLDGPLPETTSRDEVGALTTAFHHMRDSLKEYIRNLRETTAIKERLEGEMNAARRIQADMLPPPTAGGASADYELSAILEPARAVGGDLFDHFEQERHVFFLLGDVSGKGVAAALFMARAKTLFDAVAATERDPGAVLATLNRGLCRQNAAGMYVTAVCGALDLETRTVTFATAGHEPPLLVRDGHSEPLETEGGRVLGLIEMGDYPVSRRTLAAGDALVMYTDGVSEARDPGGDFYGTERLLATTSRSATGTATAITNDLLRDVKMFTADAPQSDDITILTLKLSSRSIADRATA